MLWKVLRRLPLLSPDPLEFLPSYQWQSEEPWFWPVRPGAGSCDGAPGEGPGKNKPGGSSSLPPSHTFRATKKDDQSDQFQSLLLLKMLVSSTIHP